MGRGSLGGRGGGGRVAGAVVGGGLQLDGAQAQTRADASATG